MPEVTGTAIVRAIERLTAQELRESMSQRDMDLERLAERFFDRYSVPIQSRRLSTFFKSIRKLDDEGLRYVRSLSDELLRKSDEELWREVNAFQLEVEEVDSRAHQVKTQTSFISTVLRPFNNKYSYRWFVERQNELDIEQAKASIERLERMRIDSVEELYDWGVSVEQLFFDVVVHKDENSNTRSFGTVGIRSARTYLQAWTALMKRSASDILRAAADPQFFPYDGPDLNQSLPESDYSERRSKSLTDRVSFSSYSTPSSKAARREQPSMMMSAPSDFQYNVPLVSEKLISPSSREELSINATVPAFKIEIAIESKIDSSAKAKKTWVSEHDFRESIENWITTLPLLWGDAANQLLARVSISSPNGASDVTLPSLTTTDALERISAAVKALNQF